MLPLLFNVAFSLNMSSLIFLVQPTPRATQSIVATVHQGKGHVDLLLHAAHLRAPFGSQTQAKDRRKVDKAHQHLHKE